MVAALQVSTLTVRHDYDFCKQVLVPSNPLAARERAVTVFFTGRPIAT